jgi:hypothetical protein
MKKITLLIISVFVFAAYSFGQFSKGSILAGGSVGASFGSDKNTSAGITTYSGSRNSFSFTPLGGYFFMDNLAGGAGINLNTASAKDDRSASSLSETSFAFQPFVRYYYQKFYGQFAVGFGSYKTEDTNKNSVVFTDKGSISNWSLRGGYAILLNDHVAIEPQIGYQSESKSPDGTVAVTSNNSGLFLQVALQVYIYK